MGIRIFRVCLIIANAIILAAADSKTSKISKILGALAIILLSISLLER